MKVNVIDGDVTQIEADTLIIAINSTGKWEGGIDDALRRVAGNYFHDCLKTELETHGRDFSALLVSSDRRHKTKFKSVIFVIDDLLVPIADLVCPALDIVIDNDMTSVSIPAIRTGVMANVYEPRTEALAGLARTINLYTDGIDKDISLEEINVVTYNNPGDFDFLRQEIRSF